MDMDDNEDELPSYLITPELAWLIARGNDLLARLDAGLPGAPARVDWRVTLACRWRKQSGLGIGMLAPVTTLNCRPRMCPVPSTSKNVTSESLVSWKHLRA